MYYLNSRMKTIESSVAQQNIMMSDVVASIRKDVFEQEVAVEDEDAPVTAVQHDERLYVSDDSVEESDTETEPEQEDIIKETVTEPTPIYKNMKVDELRKLIQESDLAPSDGVGKLKKQEMIDILSN